MSPIYKLSEHEDDQSYYFQIAGVETLKNGKHTISFAGEEALIKIRGNLVTVSLARTTPGVVFGLDLPSNLINCASGEPVARVYDFRKIKDLKEGDILLISNEVEGSLVSVGFYKEKPQLTSYSGNKEY